MRLFKKTTKNKLGLTLSGGGARGIAHIGALRVFEEENIKFEYVTGTSAGSLIGAFYAAGKTSYEIEELAKSINPRDIVENRFLKVGNNSGNITKIVKNFLGDITFADLKIPFKCVAVDIERGVEVVLSSGSVCDAITASSAVPAVFTPVEIDGKILVDGGLLNNIPSDVCRNMGADFVVTVDLNHNRSRGTSSLKIREQLKATWRIMSSMTAVKGLENSDIVIEPELRIFKSTQLAEIDQMIEEGYRVTKRKIPQIRELIK